MFKYNPNLISLKCVIFLFFGALGSFFPFLPLHMNDLGLSKDEAVTITAVAALVATIGPLIVAPLADRLAGTSSGGTRSKSGKYLKLMIAVCLILSVIFYWLLATIPRVPKIPSNKRGPLKVSFMCNEHGGYVLQDRCDNEETCYNWNSEIVGTVLVKNCDFTCEVTPSWTNEVMTEPPNGENTSSGQEVYSEAIYEENSDWTPPIEAEIPSETVTTPRVIYLGLEPIPHMCHATGPSNNKTQICDVYTPYSDPIPFEISLKPNENVTGSNDTESFCRYPIATELNCRMPAEVIQKLKSENEYCEPVIGCEIHWPYNNTDSLLRKSQCGYGNISFYLYILVRSLGDIFPAAALVLIDTAIVIATRETSTGRGDVGKQFALGALGLAVFPPLVGWLGHGSFLVAIITFTILMLVAALILILDSNMPLSPPEWWWHTRCGMLALPMSSVRKYGFEVIALGIVFFCLGIFWNAIDAFLPWHIVKLNNPSAAIIGLTYAIGAIPAVAYLTFAEKIVDYCGHSNILILCFVNYIVHHLALVFIQEASIILICEILEIVTLHFMWVTAVLYLRHLVPRKYTTCGQALPVITHFCLGRFVGALLGGLAYSEYPDNFKRVHKWFSISAAVIATIYSISYHFYLKFYCIPPTQLPPDPAPSTVQHMNGNGNYTPLRVYHNSSSKKGHFRY
ncbi:uncharacterized protein LOC123309641 isoform X2 [Coccinella septempunctata]|uniref:uncharacterized protein LOC123309641 isoform X2 n=1 Tax=Coccinella septempunctata TaxID=41139 RepID=UPI001D087C4C|nr:uncharacterized protein LOC123309641 isoform X2 [Coccinella septempunctata]